MPAFLHTFGMYVTSLLLGLVLCEAPGASGGAGGTGGGTGGSGGQSGATGGAGGAGAAGGAGGGSQGNAGAAGAGGGGGGTGPIRLAADSEIIFDGMDQPMRFSDWHQSWGEHYRNQLLQNLRNVAAAGGQGGQGGGRGQQGGGRGQQQQPQQGIDLQRLRSMGLLDGPTAAELIETGVLPLQQYVGQMTGVIQQLAQQVQSLQQGQGAVRERFSRSDFDGLLNNSITALGEDFDPQDKFLRELGETLYLSYDPSDKTLNRDFPKLFKELVTGVEKWIRTRDKARLEKAKSTPRKFTRPGGDGTPGGKAKYRPETPQELSQMLFGNANANT